jgi:vacuolar-type H+-ATPase subunit E/Vma4
MTATTTSGVGLEPLRAALVERATREADELVRAAEAQGRASLSEARREVDAAIETAREQGRTEGRELLAAELFAARRRGRARLLAEQRGVYDEIREAARHTVLGVLDEAGNRRRLAALLTARLGGAAEVHTTPDGGLAAVSPEGRTVDGSVGALADLAMGQLDLARLWSPR